MSAIAANQGRVFLQLWNELRPAVRTDRNLPSRIQQRLAGERRFGSRDRRVYRELLYTAVRYLPWVEECERRSAEDALRAVLWLAADLPALAAAKATLPEDWPRAVPAVADKMAVLAVRALPLPEWFRPHRPEAFTSPNLDVLQNRGRLWLRLQTADVGRVTGEFTARGWGWTRSEVLPDALSLVGEPDVTASDAYRSGLIEIQDLGSQLLLAVAATAGPLRGHWLDACAGAGGKTLQLAALLGEAGRVEATDPRREALQELRERAARAGCRNIVIREHLAVGASYDGVLVDAPCSGSGTWRRSPHLKWVTSESDIETAARVQTSILEKNHPFVRPGGLLVYATCSLSRRENEDVVSGFLARHPDFSPEAVQPLGAAAVGPGSVLFLPAVHDTDGFFVAVLRRTAGGDRSTI